MRYPSIVGLDLGQVADFTALSVIQPVGDALHVRHLERLRGVPYTRIVADTAALLARPALSGAALVIDQTGCGRPVYDMFVAAGLKPVGVTITGGDTLLGNARDGYRAPKRDLVAAAQVALQNERLKVAATLDLASTLVAELLNFRVTISLSGHDSYGAGPSTAWREGNHDDLLLSVALAVWFADLKQPSRQLVTW